MNRPTTFPFTVRRGSMYAKGQGLCGTAEILQEFNGILAIHEYYMHTTSRGVPNAPTKESESGILRVG